MHIEFAIKSIKNPFGIDLRIDIFVHMDQQFALSHKMQSEGARVHRAAIVLHSKRQIILKENWFSLFSSFSHSCYKFAPNK